MAVIDQVRALVRDSGTTQRFTDADLSYVMEFAVGEVNAWSGETYTLADYESGIVPTKHSQVFYLVCKIWSVQMDIQDPRFVKYVTQDVQYDPDQMVTRLNRMLKLLQDDLENKLKKFFGLDVGSYLAAPTEFTEQDYG